jgi:hypothetical protein
MSFAYWQDRQVPSKITSDEEVAMLIVTFCEIGDVKTFFEHERSYDGTIGKVKTTLEFNPPNSRLYLCPYDFLRNKQLQNALRTGLFKLEGKAFEACEMAWKYIEAQGYLR